MINKKSVIITISALAACVMLFFVLRIFLFNYIINKIKNRLESEYNLNLVLKNSEFKGFSGFLFTGILVNTLPNDTVFYSDSVFLQIKPFSLLAGNIRVRKLLINQIKFDLSGDILDKFLNKKKKRKENIGDIIHADYSKTANRIISYFFSIVPNEIRVDSAFMHFRRGKLKLTISCPGFRLSSKEFEGQILLTDSTNYSRCILKGTIDREFKKIDISICTANNQLVTLPYIDQKWDVSIKFDTLRFLFNCLDYNSEKITVDGYFQADNFHIRHNRIAPTPVIIKNGAADIICNVGNDYIEIDSISKIAVNYFAFSPYLKYQNHSGREITFRIPFIKFEADKLIKSFPEGLFSSIRDMKTSGNLSFQLNSIINLDNPDSTHLYAKLDKEDFRINHFGAANLTMMNDTFSHRVYDDDKQVRIIFVSPENTNFVKLDDISPFLRFSVLTSEDAGFFYHKGFNEESFANSIIQNLKEKRFARGGSTITMQLVKNVYLTRNKSISRKLEEMLIVWMIENFHLVTKERMFEVYLNVIEWGPGIYGIKQAAWYYFNKKPSELNLQESIFLASIIPSPRYFKYAFKEPGKLTNYYAWFYQRLPELMVARNQILPADTIGLKPDVVLTGEAKDFLLKPDTIKVDTSEIEQPIILENQ